MSERSGLNGGKASDWPRPDPRLEYGFHPKSFAPFSKRYPFGALRLHIPSRLEGTRGVVGKKAGGLADARHMCNMKPVQWRIQDFPVGGGPPTWVPFGKNERIGSH